MASNINNCFLRYADKKEHSELIAAAPVACTTQSREDYLYKMLEVVLKMSKCMVHDEWP